MFKSFIFVNYLFFVMGTSNEQSWHTSNVAIQQLFDLQNEHFNIFKEYVDSETKRLDELKIRLVTIYEWRHSTFTEINPLHNHITALKFAIRIHQQLSKTNDLTNNYRSMKVLEKKKDQRDLGDSDITMACRAILKLQEFYKIPTSDMAAGIYNGRNIGDRMDACDCYTLATRCLEDNDMFGTEEWAIQTYNRLTDGSGQSSCVDIEKLHFYIVMSSVYTGFDYKTLFNSSIQNHLEGTTNYAQYFSLMRDNMISNRVDNLMFDILDKYINIKNKISYVNEEYRDLCIHGEYARPLTKEAICRYQTMNSYYRILMPFKEELINNYPNIKIYHDVMTDYEIIKLKSIAMQEMNDTKFDNVLLEHIRSGQIKWVDKEENFNSLNARIETITGRSIQTAEQYQIVNYGIAGHYSPHYDAFLRSELINDKFGNRLLTVLFYLSDVQNDGYTVFNKLNFVAPVEKGSALIWDNLHVSNGSIHEKSMHAGCPMLKGNKWIMTCWIREEGQFLPYKWKDSFKGLTLETMYN